MKTTDLRNAQFEEIQGRLSGDRRAVWEMLYRIEAPVTTRELARVSSLDLLSVRPRVTELVEMGLVRLAGKRRHEGLYQALTMAQVRAQMLAQRRAAAPAAIQQDLFLQTHDKETC